jgi:hypothetical protein
MDPQLQRLLSDPIFRHGDAIMIGYLVALRGYEKPPQMEGVRDEAYNRGLELGRKDREAGRTPAFIGYCPDDLLPIKRGQTVTIPKGVTITYRGEKKVNERTRKVKVDHLLNGTNFHGNHRGDAVPPTSPSVRWPGSGGYWSEVDINDVPEAREAVKAAQHQVYLEEAAVMAEKLEGVLEEARKTAASYVALTAKEGFHVRFHSDGKSLQMDAVTDDHTTIASLSVETYFTARKFSLRINITSNICRALPDARLVFRALSLVMATAEKIDTEYCQPWNQQ